MAERMTLEQVRDALFACGKGHGFDNNQIDMLHGFARVIDANLAQPAQQNCFCDRMYPDSAPDASCGDCPTRDYKAIQPAQAVDVGAVREVAAGMDCIGSAGSDEYSTEYLLDCINDYSAALTSAIDANLPKLEPVVDVCAEAYAERLARALWRKHYADDAPQWEPLTGDLLGLLSQIDNMTTQLTRAIGNAQPKE